MYLLDTNEFSELRITTETPRHGSGTEMGLVAAPS